MARVRAGDLTVTSAAAELEISRNQFYRLWRSYLRALTEHRQEDWTPGVSGGDHRPDPTPELEALLNKLLRSRPPCSYSLVASEAKRRLGIDIDRATVRRWALAHGAAPDTAWKTDPQPVHRWEVQAVGQLWQYDASPHAWLGPETPLAHLLEIIDDCSRVITGARLYQRETLLAHLDFLSRTFQAVGLPLALYVDYHSFFFSQRPDQLTCLAEALRFYEVTVRYAPTPQAKGKIERAHLFWQNRLPPLLMAEAIRELAPANALLDQLRNHHNEHEQHRELQTTPKDRWDTCVRDQRSVLRPPPTCPWWPYVFSLRARLKVARDGRIPIRTERLRVDCSPGVCVVRCIHPNGDVSVLLHPPKIGTLPMRILHLPAPPDPHP